MSHLLNTAPRLLTSLTEDESKGLFKAAFGRYPVPDDFSSRSFPALEDGEMGRQYNHIMVDDELNAIQLWDSGSIRAYQKDEQYEEFQVTSFNARRVINYLDSLNITFGEPDNLPIA